MRRTRKRKATGKSCKSATRKKAAPRSSGKKVSSLNKVRLKRTIDSIKLNVKRLEKELSR